MENEFDVLMESFPKRKLRDFIEPINKRNSHLQYGPELIEGVNNLGEFVPTKAQIENVDMRPYKLVEKGDFVYNPSRLSIGSLAYRRNGKKCIVSHLYVVFRIKPGFSNVLLSEFLLLYFRRNEFNRMVDYHNYGSQRAEFGFKDIGEFKIPLPPIEVQRAYVKAYQGLTTLIEQNESLVKELEKTAQACIVECREKWPMVEIRNFIKESNSRNTESLLTKEDIVGVSTEKNFISTKADTTTVSTEGYKIVEARFFVFVPDTSRRGDKMSLAFNSLNRRVLVTSIATVFEVFDLELLLPEYLFLQFKRPEFDRYARFNSWGSARETFTWEDMCRVKIPLPPIEVQRAYVKAYQGLTTLIEQNESLVKELEKTAQACIVECREKWPMVEIRNFIKESNSRNTESLLTKEDIVGVSTEKNFISTKADTTTVSTEGYKIVEARFFVFVPDTSRRGDKMSLAFNSLNRRVLVTSIATVFEVFDLELLLPEYLFLQFKRPEFDRYARFNSWGSARETFTWEDMCRVKIPLPPIEVQRAIVALYTCAEEARKIAAEARELLKKACPAMVQSAAHYKVGAFR